MKGEYKNSEKSQSAKRVKKVKERKRGTNKYDRSTSRLGLRAKNKKTPKERLVFGNSVLTDAFFRQLEKNFKVLAQEWKISTAHLSSITEISIHPAYQRIIGMGERAVPYILKEMSDSPYHWFWALKAITGADPVPPEHHGRIKLMTEDWLVWGRQNGYIQ